MKTTVKTPALLPTRAHPTDAGLDLRSTHTTWLEPGERQLIPTGVAIELPTNTAGLICPRSGLAHQQGITVLNAPGIIDAGYRGEIKVNLVNLSDEVVAIRAGDRIAQLLITPILTPDIELVHQLHPAPRGTKGHGSTGK